MKQSSTPITFRDLDRVLAEYSKETGLLDSDRKQLRRRLTQLATQARALTTDAGQKALNLSVNAVPQPPETINTQKNLLVLLTLLLSKSRRKSVRTLQSITNDAKRVFNSAKGATLDRIDITAWEIMSHQLEANSRRRLISTWRQLRKMWSETYTGLIAPVRWSQIEPPHESRFVFVPSWEEIVRILSCLAVNLSCGPAVYMAVLLATFFGLRERECVQLQLGQIQFGERLELIIVRSKRSKSRFVTELYVPEAIKQFIQMAFQARLKATGGNSRAYFLVDDCGEPLARRHLLRVFQAAARQAGITPPDPLSLTFHTLRHYCACRLIALGVPLQDVRDYLGHANADTTAEHYVHVWGDVDSLDSDLTAKFGPSTTFIPIRWLASQLNLSLPGLTQKMSASGLPFEITPARRLGLPSTQGRPILGINAHAANLHLTNLMAKLLS